VRRTPEPNKPAPLVCACGYAARDAEDMAAHLLRAGAFEDKRGKIRLLPDKPHVEPRKDSDGQPRLVPPVSKVGIRRTLDNALAARTRPPDEDDGALVPRLRPQPRQLRHDSARAGRWWAVPVNLGVLSFLSSVVVLSQGSAAASALLDGPLSPWASTSRWLWHHGEVSIPLALALVALVALPWTRRTIVRGIARGLETIGLLLSWSLLVAVGVGLALYTLLILNLLFTPVFRGGGVGETILIASVGSAVLFAALVVVTRRLKVGQTG